jgi:hypothetical protein
MAAADAGFELLRDRFGIIPTLIYLEVFAPASDQWVSPIYRGEYRTVQVRWGVGYPRSWVERFDWCLAAMENEARLEAMTPR